MINLMIDLALETLFKAIRLENFDCKVDKNMSYVRLWTSFMWLRSIGDVLHQFEHN